MILFMAADRKTTDGFNGGKAMKRIYMYLVAAMAIASAASCTEQISDNERPAELGTMTISAQMGAMSKTVYDNQNVLWEGNEQITVFSLGETVADRAFDMTSCSEDKTKAQFTGIADLVADMYLAVYPHSAENSCTPEGTVSVSIPAVQTAVAGGFASGANVAVASFVKGDASVVFNNICTLLSFGFETDADAVLTESVTIKVKKNETDYHKIAGTVNVSYSEGEPVVSEGTAEEVVVNAPEGGFVKGVTYYVPVAPVGDIAGMELTYIHTDGTTTCTRKNDTDDTFARNSLFALGQVPVAYDNLPQEDFEVMFDFTGEWPFEESCKDISAQTKQGIDYYTYKHPTLDLTLETALMWGDFSGDKGYKHEEGTLYCTTRDSGNSNGTTYVKIPVIPGRYLTKVLVLHNTGSEKRFVLNKGFGTSKTQISGNTYVNSSSESAFAFPSTYNSTKYESELGAVYSIRARDFNIKIQKITAVYSKTKPE